MKNIWLRSNNERIFFWRDFRIDLKERYKNKEISLRQLAEEIVQWWKFSPLVNLNVDPERPESWPDIWEIIDHGSCCFYSKSIAIAYNLHFVDLDLDIQICRHFSFEDKIDRFVVVVENEYLIDPVSNQVEQFDDELEFCDVFDIKRIIEVKGDTNAKW